MKKTFLLIWLILIPVTAISAEIDFNTTIKMIYPLSDGSIVLQFNDNSGACSNNNNPDFHYLTVGESGVTQAGLDIIYSAALTAATTQKTVRVYFDNSTSQCFINRMRVIF